MKKLFFTSALPYANGHLHLGHILEFIQADIFIKYNKMIGNLCFYISGDDCHGTPIMLKSIQNNVSFDNIFNFYRSSHINDLRVIGIDLDSFYFTHSYENEFFSRRIFIFLKCKKFIFEKSIFQFYDEEKKMFLPDRYVVGNCPRCNIDNQYGDVCEKCSYKYDATDLLNPISVLSNKSPIKKHSRHYFFDLEKFDFFLKNWCVSLSQKSVVNKLFDWLVSGLKSWDVSRDSPYFGFKVPNEYFKFIYVWLDAPIGYISSLYNFCLNNNFEFSSFFNDNSDYNLYHFIGKDIIYFHTLFWPSILNACNFNLPGDVFVHGFLTINGKKMSKSSGTFLLVHDFFNLIEQDYLRYYFSTKLNDAVVDIDFNINDFIEKINSELISKFVNIGGRCASIICKYFNNVFSSNVLDKDLFQEYLDFNLSVNDFYSNRCYSRVISGVMKYSDYLNLYLDREKPWLLLKNDKTFSRAHDVCTSVLNLFIILLVSIKPILPDLFDRFEYLFNLSNLNINFLKKPILGLNIKPYKHVYQKLDLSNFNNIFSNL